MKIFATIALGFTFLYSAYGQDASSKYDYIYHYFWQDGWYWKLDQKIIYNYENGLQVEINIYLQAYRDSIWKISKQILYNYNIQGKISSEIIRVWDIDNTDSLVNNKKRILDYNNFGKINYEVKQEWSDSIWINKDKYLYEYDTLINNITTFQYQWNKKNNDWQIPSKKTEYLKNYNKVLFWDSISYFTLVDNEWKINYQIYPIFKFDKYGNVIDVIYQYNSGENINKTLYSYDERFNVIEKENLNWYNNNWFSFRKYQYRYDINDKLLEFDSLLIENNEWVDGFKTIYKYNPQNRLLEDSVIQWKNGQWFNVSKDEYKYIATNIGELDEQIGNNEVNIFPNPASDRLIIQLSHWMNPIVHSNLAIEIYSTLGKIIHTLPNLIQEQRSVFIDMSDLSQGIYFINIINNGKIIERKKINIIR